MDVLINLLFSNVWVIILVYLLIRLFSKSYSKQIPRKRTVGPVVGNPAPVPATARSMRGVPSVDQASVSKQQIENKEGIKQQVDIEVIKLKDSLVKDKDKNENNDRGLSTPWSSAVQGMMWSEVFGPPRSKKPYQPK